MNYVLGNFHLLLYYNFIGYNKYNLQYDYSLNILIFELKLELDVNYRIHRVFEIVFYGYFKNTKLRLNSCFRKRKENIS